MCQQENGEEPLLELPDQDLEPGVLPTEIRKLVQSRRQVKSLMKDPNLSKEAYMQVGCSSCRERFELPKQQPDLWTEIVRLSAEETDQ